MTTIAALALLGMVLLAVFLLKGGGGSAAPQPPSTPLATEQPDQSQTEQTQEQSQSEETTPSNPAPATVSSSSVEQLLSEYSSDYSSEDAEGLRGLFSESLTRVDGSHSSEDLEEAVATYEKQFGELREPRYTLSSIHVEPTGGEATATADYSISSQNGTVHGSIAFHLAEQEGRLLIDSIHVSPSK